jgi:SPP1 family predicted phage head-tail adaptor
MVACGCSASFASMARTRVTIQQPTLTDDGIGGETKSWSDFKTVWASMKAVTNWRRQEIFQDAQVQPRMQQQVTIRYISAISDNLVAATLRVLVGTRILNVVGIQNLHYDMKTEGKAYQTLLCVEGEAA